MLLQAQFVYGHNTGVRVFARRSVLISLAIPRRGQNYLKSILEKCQATMFYSVILNPLRTNQNGYIMPWRSRASILKSHSPVKVRHGGRQLYRATFDSSLACVGLPCSRACRHKFNMSSTIPNSTKRLQDCFRKRKYTTFLFQDGAIFFLF